jgi:hypothetical protein
MELAAFAPMRNHEKLRTALSMFSGEFAARSDRLAI